MQSCAKDKGLVGTKFKVVLAGNYFVPSANETTAILLHKWPSEGKRDYNTPLALLGNKEMTEKIMGRSFEPKKLFEGRDWLENIMDAYGTTLKEAEESHFERDYSDSLARITFVTPTKGYIRIFGMDEDTVHDYYMESELLKKYFDELGLTDELSPPRFRIVGANSYRLPQTDKVVAILLYSPMLPSSNNDGCPAAVFGDRKLAEKLLYEDKGLAERLNGRPFEPRRTIEGHEWLVKIMDAYRTSLSEAKEKKFLSEGSPRGRIIFVTTKNGYSKAIGVDANTVYDKYMKSELLKKYFDELSITTEMDRLELDIDSLGQYRVLNKGKYDKEKYAPPADEITAILLYPQYDYNLYAPLALIGDKKITEKKLGISLEPKKLIEEHDWLVKITDAYKNACKEADEKKSYLESPRVDTEWRIIFVTNKKGYQEFIGVDANTVYDFYMESELLKEYFDELGLTKELLAGEPNAVANKAPQN
jgi:hypothetical protein